MELLVGYDVTPLDARQRAVHFRRLKLPLILLEHVFQRGDERGWAKVGGDRIARQRVGGFRVPVEDGSPLGQTERLQVPAALQGEVEEGKGGESARGEGSHAFGFGFFTPSHGRSVLRVCVKDPPH